MIRTFVELLDERTPILALAIHNGHEMHPELLRICGISEADRLREEDPHTDVFTSVFANKINVFTSRFTVDLNRNPDKAVYQNPEDCWGLPARTESIPEALMTELLTDYDSWYSLLKYTINRMLEKNPFLLVLDLHSYNHKRQGSQAPADPQTENPDIILGRNNMPEKYYPWVEKLLSQLDKQDINGHSIDCRIDVKFSGGWLSRWLHRNFPNQVLCLAVEFKKIFMDEWTGLVDAELQKAISRKFGSAVDLVKNDIFS